MPTAITLALFTPLIGQPFALDGPHATASLALVEAAALPTQPGAPRADPFSLVFRAARELGLTQGLVRLTHARVGTLELFLVPVGQDEQGQHFQALFT
ncbi:DUF6916 family protein [Denitromonas ohlonensis]|uniref:DUF6916 domain-containing protein n=2 Tax=Denitromonas TaxID=139331 RepID=A0A557RIH8_9RHOO|nr:hypothetical protein [Denitromonas ohlonensis]TVO64967.1 hypothetical protein FHP90_11555 [Denitromonas ohlonensis]TVO75640.1 hypothetical protein FHP89_12915 [Denitromonas ohlonensis]